MIDKVGLALFVLCACGDGDRSLCQLSAGDCGYKSDADCVEREPKVGDACATALVCYYCNAETAQGYDCIGGVWRATRTFAVCG
ncbi:MAG: hypothetical protein HY791_18335 [Deltaproteobacteria bacterium]|nr:hypothetical protein [Deltaproteobacteria bacterium]